MTEMNSLVAGLKNWIGSHFLANAMHNKTKMCYVRRPIIRVGVLIESATETSSN